jgi:hypothetical protein
VRATVPGHAGQSVRAQQLVRGGWGLALLVVPDLVVSRLGEARPDHRTRVVARILGARHLVQAVISAADPTPRVLRCGGLIDFAHASTGLALAAVDVRYRRAALTDAAIATGFGIRDVQAAHQVHSPAMAFSRERIA